MIGHLTFKKIKNVIIEEFNIYLLEQKNSIEF